MYFTREDFKKEKDLKIAHKIKLKKRLEKANSKVSRDSRHFEEFESRKQGHNEIKPNPAKKALEKAKQIGLQNEQAQFEKDLKEKERQRQIIECKKKRRLEKGLLFKKNKNGQPNLSNQINHLLSKLK